MRIIRTKRRYIFIVWPVYNKLCTLSTTCRVYVWYAFVHSIMQLAFSEASFSLPSRSHSPPFAFSLHIIHHLLFPLCYSVDECSGALLPLLLSSLRVCFRPLIGSTWLWMCFAIILSCFIGITSTLNLLRKKFIHNRRGLLLSH